MHEFGNKYEDTNLRKIQSYLPFILNEVLCDFYGSPTTVNTVESEVMIGLVMFLGFDSKGFLQHFGE